MDELIKIIAFTCLQHHDSGEASVNREARLIIAALEAKGYNIKKGNDIEYKTKTYYFNRWLATCYADEKLDSNMKHTSDNGFDSSTELSVLNRETGVWYMDKMEYFSKEVYPNIKRDDAFEKTQKLLMDIEF